METEQKPFACGIENCDMSFTNEDHLNVHRKKHDMVLNLGLNAGKCSVFLGELACSYITCFACYEYFLWIYNMFL